LDYLREAIIISWVIGFREILGGYIKPWKVLLFPQKIRTDGIVGQCLGFLASWMLCCAMVLLLQKITSTFSSRLFPFQVIFPRMLACYCGGML
jgi:hypothetical protein